MAHILVVDDYPEILAVLKATLAASGHEVTTSESGVTGLELARRLQPDLVLLDVDMPGMGGIAVCVELKRDPVTEHIPVLLMTGRLCLEVLEQSRWAGAIGVLPKPFLRVRLLEEIDRAVGEIRATR